MISMFYTVGFCVVLASVGACNDTVPPGYLILNDIHIHETYTHSTELLKWLCSQADTLKRANIQFMVLNGDLTDSGSPLFSLLGPGQREGEWKILREALEGCVQKFPIFPLPGNHDRFMVQSYQHSTNKHERAFSAEILSRHELANFDRFEGSYSVEISDQLFLFLDSSPFGINRHYWGRTSEGQLRWMSRKLSEISCVKCVTIFSHFPTGTFVPSERRKLFEVIGNFAHKISVYHSGHIHRMFGSHAFAKLKLPTAHEISELSLIDFVSSGLVRWVQLSPPSQNRVPAFVDLSIRDMKFPITGAARLGREGAVLGLVLDRDGGFLSRGPGNIPEKVFEEFSGWKQRGFLQIYEILHYAVIVIYIGLIGVLYAFWKYNRNRSEISSTPIINNLIVIFGLLMPVMPWAIGHGWPGEDGNEEGNEVVIAGVWGLVSLRTGEVRPMDLMTLHIIPLLLRTGFKCLMIYTSRSVNFVGKFLHYFSMAVVFIITVVGVKLLVLTYGPFLFLSPLAVWEVVCWGRKFHAFYLDKIKHKLL